MRTVLASSPLTSEGKTKRDMLVVQPGGMWVGVVVVVVVEVFMFVMRDGLVGGFADMMGEVRRGLMRGKERKRD